MKKIEFIFVFDKDKTRINKVRKAIGDRYEIKVISKSTDIPEELKDLAGIIIDPETKEELSALVIDILKQKRTPVFVWAPIGKPPSAWEYSLPVKVLQAPPSVRSITEGILPVLESDRDKLIILATTDDRLTNELASGLIEKGYEVKRALDRNRLEEQIKEYRDETALVFADLKFAQNLAEKGDTGPRFPLVINVPGSLGSSSGPIRIEPYVTLVNSGMRPNSIVDTIENALISGEREILKEAAIMIKQKEALLSNQMIERLLNLLVEETEKEIDETRAEEFNVLNARTMGLIDEFFDLLAETGEKTHILFEALDTPELEEEIFEIKQKLSSAQEILDALHSVDWYRSDSAPEPIAVRKLITQAIAVMKANRRRKDIEYVVNTKDSSITVCSKSQLIEVLVNIFTNSYEVFDKGGTIEVTTSSDSQWNYIEIRDNGPGIPEKVIPNITKPFYTTKSAAHKGIGLTVARGVIEMHGGELEIESDEKGTTIRFSLPRVREGKALIDKSENPDIMLIAPKKSLSFLQSMLAKCALSVVAYDNMGEAIHAAKRISPGLILIQAGLEYMDANAVRMLAGVKGKAQLVLLDPQGKLPPGINGLDTVIRGTYPAHHLISIISELLKEKSPVASVA